MKELDLILLVDDDEISNFINTQKLTKAVDIHQLDVRLNGVEAADYLDSCGGKYPDIILLDINMPLMNGFELLDMYEKSPHRGNTKFALLTSSTRPADREAAKKYGDVIGYLEKPIDDDDFRDLIELLQK